MTRSTQGAAQRRRRLLALRVAAFIAAIALAVVGVWMIVTGNSTKSVRVGAIASFWALLLGAFAVLGSRVPSRDTERFTEPVAPVASQPPPPPPHHTGVDVRHVGDVERAAVAAARREFQATLQEMLQREVAAAVSREMAGLRSDVTALRNELVEKVGGQLHLERIETTRLIGSDLEALQHEVQQLRHTAGLEGGDPTRSMRITHTLEPPAPGTNHDVHDAEIVVERVHVSSAPVSTQASVIDPHTDAEQPFPEEPATAEPVTGTEPAPPSESESMPGTAAAPIPPEEEPVPQQPAPWPAAAPPPEPVEADAGGSEPEPEAAPERAQPSEASERIPETAAAAARAGGDPFAGLPRLTPFTEFPLDPISASEDSAPEDNGIAEGAGHRHRAEDEDGSDVLARILARERSR